jgi:ParB/RepB/Spo0J family partition protein
VRPLPNGEAGTYELVAGARRYRASKLAKRESIPATVRELTDAQALELQVIENVQRVDVHPLDEAQGYAALIQLQPNTYTVESIATRVGRSPAYVSWRLRLIQLIPEAKQAFYEDKLTVAQAFEVARLQPNDQRRALQECFPHHRNAGAVLKDKRAEAVTVRELRGWIAREIHLRIQRLNSLQHFGRVFWELCRERFLIAITEGLPVTRAAIRHGDRAALAHAFVTFALKPVGTIEQVKWQRFRF